MATVAERTSLVEAVGSLEAETVSFLEELIRTPSVNPPGEYAEIHELVTTRLETYDWDVETVWADDERLESLDLTHPRPNVLATVARGDGPTIALNAHLDTVPVDDEASWTYDPFGGTVDGGRMYGRGAADCKCRIASYALALRALDATDLLPEDATVVLALTADEEVGGHAGAGYLVESGALRPDYAIVEGYSDSIWYATAGVNQFRITVTGASAHAGLDPDGGANAILGASRVLDELEAYADELRERTSDVEKLGGPTCTPGTIEGGAKTNIVPATCSFTVDQRVPPDYDAAELDEELRRVVARADLPDGTEVDVERFLAAAPCRSDRDAPHVEAVRENAEAILGRTVPVEGARGFTDARFFAAAGAECLNFGPGDSLSNPHGVDESVSLDQVRDVGAVIAASVLDFARTDADD